MSTEYLQVRVRKFNPAWASHIPVLVRMMGLSHGPVLELGIGLFSTPLLHWLCLERRRRLYSYDNSEYFVEKARNFRTDWHIIEAVPDWTKLDLDIEHWGMAFVDHAPTEDRHLEAKRLAWLADYVVLHDSDRKGDRFTHYSEIYSLYKYHYDYCRQKPYTTILSNFYPLDGLCIGV